MRTIGYIIQKEFKQIFRNRAMLPIIFALPILQLLILSNAATYEVKNIKFSYIDGDHTSTSRALIEKFSASTYFDVLASYESNKKANEAMLAGEVDVILEIPNHFERDLVKETSATLRISSNAIAGAAARIRDGYNARIVQSSNQETTMAPRYGASTRQKPIKITSIASAWYKRSL